MAHDTRTTAVAACIGRQERAALIRGPLCLVAKEGVRWQNRGRGLGLAAPRLSCAPLYPAVDARRAAPRRCAAPQPLIPLGDAASQALAATGGCQSSSPPALVSRSRAASPRSPWRRRCALLACSGGCCRSLCCCRCSHRPPPWRCAPCARRRCCRSSPTPRRCRRRAPRPLAPPPASSSPATCLASASSAKRSWRPPHPSARA